MIDGVRADDAWRLSIGVNIGADLFAFDHGLAGNSGLGCAGGIFEGGRIFLASSFALGVDDEGVRDVEGSMDGEIVFCNIERVETESLGLQGDGETVSSGDRGVGIAGDGP